MDIVVEKEVVMEWDGMEKEKVVNIVHVVDVDFDVDEN
jgi:hypothetical protein